MITVSTEGFYQKIISGWGIVANLTTNLNQEYQSRYVFAGLTNRLLTEESVNEDGVYIGVASVSGDINDVGGFMTQLGVNFGDWSWGMKGAEFYGLQNGSIYVPLSANGSITGNTFKSDSISFGGNENYIQTGSYINGKFLGPQAKAITGEADITTISLPTPAISAPSIPSMNIKATFAGQKDFQDTGEIY